jgi:integrase
MQMKMRAAPYRGNRVLALASKLFTLAILWQYRADNPAKGVGRNHEEKRERYLGPAELSALLDTLTHWPNATIANIILFALLTGARRSEILGARWAEINLDNGTWTKRAARTKQAKLHVVPLSEAALTLLRSLPQDGPFVFPNGAGKPHSDIWKSWAAICRAAGIAGLRLHDCRHSYASAAINAGLDLPVIGKLLGHTRPATTARYAHLADSVARDATNKVGEIITDASKNMLKGVDFTVLPA